MSWRKHFSFAVWSLLFWTAPAGAATDWQLHLQSLTPKTYACPLAPKPIQIDGDLSDSAWATTPWTEDFVDIEGARRPTPRWRTRAKLLWDAQYLYVAAELEEPHVWATLTNHDAVIFYDPDFEVFLDPDGDTHGYFEFEINAKNTGWDLRLPKPYQDQGQPENHWEIAGFKSAVRVTGTINDPRDEDKGWTVELAFPWAAFTSTNRPQLPPREGEIWRLNFSRVEWQIGITNGQYSKIPGQPENNWVWSPQGVVDMHRPEMWGRLVFTRTNQTQGLPEWPGREARKSVLAIYYAQRDFWAAHQRYATNLQELAALENSVTNTAVTLEQTSDGFIASAQFHAPDGSPHTWRIRQDRLLKLDEPIPVETELFVAEAARQFGDAGRRAAYFLVDNMPAQDRAGLTREFLLENLQLAFQARRDFPWAQRLAEPMFFNDVLPYVSLDEPRDPWRADFIKLAGELVRDCTTATEAAQALNRELFKRLNVHYHLGRKRNNQSPRESIEQGKATCTGLSIILVDACRAVGIPARVVGVPEWAQKNGNHTWVEIWDGDWFFTGADEYDAQA
ncbi:MAG: transglutaminase domain-containing protein [Verrucomicrobiota bacterium]